jgi:hypothetical protein
MHSFFSQDKQTEETKEVEKMDIITIVSYPLERAKEGGIA